MPSASDASTRIDSRSRHELRTVTRVKQGRYAGSSLDRSLDMRVAGDHHAVDLVGPVVEARVARVAVHLLQGRVGGYSECSVHLEFMSRRTLTNGFDVMLAVPRNG